MNAFIGGLLIGLSALILFISLGRVLGISGICGSLLNYTTLKENKWRILFIAGLLISALIIKLFSPDLFIQQFERSPIVYIFAGLFVGFGTQMSNGCTSGHGICGISRFSVRSIAATATFILFGIITVLVLRLGGF